MDFFLNVNKYGVSFLMYVFTFTKEILNELSFF